LQALPETLVFLFYDIILSIYSLTALTTHLRLSHEISQITKQLGTWLTSSTSGLPDKLRERKLEGIMNVCVHVIFSVYIELVISHLLLSVLSCLY
jgi:hypothetical protein